MNSIKQFWIFFQESLQEIAANKKEYLYAFLSLVLLANSQSLYIFFGGNEESNFFICLNILTALLNFAVISSLVLNQKKKQGGSGELLYFVPTFLLYNLYYSFLFFIGLVLLLIPGFYVLIYFSLVPFVAVLDDSSEQSVFKRSRELVKKNVGLVATASLITLFLELTILVLNPIQNSMIKLIATFGYSLIDGVVTIAMTLATVKIYYSLVTASKKTQDESS